MTNFLPGFAEERKNWSQIQ